MSAVPGEADEVVAGYQTHTDYLLSAIVDGSFDAIVSKDLNSIIRSWNGAAQRMFGYAPDEAIGRPVTMLIPDKLQSEESDIISRIRRGERVESFETIRLRKDGSTINVSLTISPIKDARGVIIGASKIARDITATKEAEKRIRVLLREVNHRVKNQFAVILSIIRETSNRALSPADFERQIRDRIMALSRSHDLLVNTDWSGASLLELIHDHLSLFGHEQEIILSGPLVTVNSSGVQNLGMAIHELGTNSAKYGVLAAGCGAVKIDWHIETDPDGTKMLELVWDEQLETAGVVALNPSQRRGFGSTVLERVVPLALLGSATLERGDNFVRWTLRAPFEAVAQRG